jgi:uncharacterized membrane protein YcaP (DUF421 family)
MESVLRAVAIYPFLIVLFRIAGKRSLSEVSTFEFVLLLVVGEATGQAVIGKDFSVTNAYLVILTLVALQIAMTLLKERSETVRRWLDGLPVVLVENGQPIKDRLDKVRVGEDAILAAARELQGLERMEQIKYAVMESTGVISIIPKDGESK